MNLLNSLNRRVIFDRKNRVGKALRISAINQRGRFISCTGIQGLEKKSKCVSRRILVIGSGGAGKSTFAHEIGTVLGLPVIHLDSYFWTPGWQRVDDEAWERITDDLITGERWIMDGNYGGTMEKRVAAADAIIFLALPRLVCLYRAIKRQITKRRVDIIPGCKEKIDLQFVKWIWTYPRRRRPRTQALLERYSEEKLIYELRTRRQVSQFIQRAEEKL